MNLCFAICTFVLSLAMLVAVIASNAKPSTISCANSSELKVQADGGACLVQGIAFFYFTLSGHYYRHTNKRTHILASVWNERYVAHDFFCSVFPFRCNLLVLYLFGFISEDRNRMEA